LSKLNIFLNEVISINFII